MILTSDTYLFLLRVPFPALTLQYILTQTAHDSI